jgi:hypothetical protein
LLKSKIKKIFLQLIIDIIIKTKNNNSLKILLKVINKKIQFKMKMVSKLSYNNSQKSKKILMMVKLI